MIDATKSQAQQKTVKLSLQTEQQGGHVQGVLPTSKEGAERSLRKLAGWSKHLLWKNWATKTVKER